MLGPDAAIALVRDQDPARLFKVRYYEDHALKGLCEGQRGGVPLKEPASMPEAPLPGVHQNEHEMDKPETVRVEPQPDQAAAPAESPAEKLGAKLGVIRGKQRDLRSAVTAHRQEEGTLAHLSYSVAANELGSPAASRDGHDDRA